MALNRNQIAALICIREVSDTSWNIVWNVIALSGNVT